MARWLIFLIFFTLLSCGPSNGDFITLDSRWLPLRRVQQASWIESGAAVTNLNVVLVHNLRDFTSLDLVTQEAVLSHEQLHAIHQQELGFNSFSKIYNNNIAFRIKEEKDGWKLQIEYSVKHGVMIDPYWVAYEMSTHYGGVFEFNAILAWAAQIITDAKNK